METTAVRTEKLPGEWNFRAEPGRTIGLLGPAGGGLTRLGLTMLAEPSQRAPVAAVDVRGWLSPLAAHQAGVDLGRLVIIRSGDRLLWSQVVAALLEGLRAVYAEVPPGVSDAHLRRLAALARSRRGALLLRPLDGRLPSGIAHLALTSEEVGWDGPAAGHGSLRGRRVLVRARGKGVGGIDRMLEVDDGENALRVVARLVAPPAGRAAG